MILNFPNIFKNFSLWNQRAARVVPLLLIVLIGMQLAKMTWLVLPQPPAQPPVTNVAVPILQGKTIPPLDTVLQSLARFNPWEQSLPKKIEPAPPPPPPPEETVVVTELALDLIGTMVLPDQASWGILVRRGRANLQLVLRVGEEVDGAILERIERNAVYLRNHGRLEKLSMVGSEDDRITDLSSQKKISPNVQDKNNTISRHVYSQLLSKGMGLLSGVNIMPFYQGGNSVGYQLKFSEDNPDMHQFGLQNGDVIKKVSGISVLDQKKLSQFAPQLRSQTALTIEVLRNNRPETLHISIGP